MLISTELQTVFGPVHLVVRCLIRATGYCASTRHRESPLGQWTKRDVHKLIMIVLVELLYQFGIVLRDGQ
jgi:hypothetical protein